MSEDLRSRLYRFIDPWEAEALSPGAPDDCAGYIGRCSYEPVLAGAVVDVLMRQEGWDGGNNNIGDGGGGEVGGLPAPPTAAGGGLISKVNLHPINHHSQIPTISTNSACNAYHTCLAHNACITRTPCDRRS